MKKNNLEIDAVKVLLLNTNDTGGGAAIACVRLLRALRKGGMDASLLVLHKRSREEGVVSISSTAIGRFFRFAWERFFLFVAGGASRRNLFAVSLANTGFSVVNHPLFQAADVVHLHWINQGFLSCQEVKQIMESGKKIVWTLHDMWPITGICHHGRRCKAYRKSCGNCPFLRFEGRNDLSYRVFLKKTAWRKERLTWVGCSRWLADKVLSSALCGGAPVYAIPNPLDTDFWRPILQERCRSRLGLPVDKTILFFGAANATDPRKGILVLQEALQRLSKAHSDLREQILLVVAGRWQESLSDSFPFSVKAMGYVDSPEQMRDLYNAADIFLLPSLEENLPNTVMEAMACATPVVACAVGGIPEMICDGLSGALVAPGDAVSLAETLWRMLSCQEREQLGMVAREQVLREYAEEVVVGRYRALYGQ